MPGIIEPASPIFIDSNDNPIEMDDMPVGGVPDGEIVQGEAMDLLTEENKASGKKSKKGELDIDYMTEKQNRI